MENTNSKEILPKITEIPSNTLKFINSKGFIKSLENPSNFEDPTNQLNSKCALLQTHLHNLYDKLSTLLISSVSNSIHAKCSLQDFVTKLENLGIISSYYGSHAQRRNFKKIVDEELSYIARGLQRIDNICQYAVVALKLEALVGDLEDAALSALNRQSGHIFSRTSQSSSIPVDDSGKLDNVRRAVKAVNSIEELLLSITEIHPQWRNLLKTVDARVDKVLAVLRPQVIADHRSLLASLGWPPKLSTAKNENGDDKGIPNPLVLMRGEKKESYSQSFFTVCALQHVKLLRDERQRSLLGHKKEETYGLWAIDELVSPIASKIEHHCLKWTDQPEFIFALVCKVTNDFIEGVDNILQPLIDKARLVSCCANEAWVSAMVQVLSGFLAKKVFPVLAERYRDKCTRSDAISSWLFLIDQIVRFDKRMQSFVGSETYLFLTGTSTGLAPRMSAFSSFCDRPDWLNIWAKVELKDAWKKLKAEVDDEKAWSTGKIIRTGQILVGESEQFCLSTGEDLKAPRVAEFALNAAWEMIQRSQTLPGTARRIQFIRAAPVTFLWHFFKLLLSKHSRSDFMRCDSERTLARVCQLTNAARFTELKLREWSDNVEFLELILAEKGLSFDNKGDATNSNGFFDEEIGNLIEMETNWLMEMITHILCQFENSTFYYFHNVEHFGRAQLELNQVTPRDKFISEDLVVALDNLRNHLLIIREHLNANDFLDTWRSVAEGLDHFTFRSIQSIGFQFSDEGAKQFAADMQGLFLVFKAFCTRPEAFFPCIRDLLKLLEIGKEEVAELKSNFLDSANSYNCLLHSHNI